MYKRIQADGGSDGNKGRTGRTAVRTPVIISKVGGGIKRSFLHTLPIPSFVSIVDGYLFYQGNNLLICYLII